MNIRLGQPVATTDGPFGEVGDLVLDPLDRRLTHVVVQPRKRHQQARIVPVAAITIVDDVVTVDVDAAHIRSFELVSDARYVRLGEPITPGDTWDVGSETMMMPSYMGGAYGYWVCDDHAMVHFDRVPRHEVEISAESAVVTSDAHWVGSVEGLVLADDDHVNAVVVRAGRHGIRHYVVVPVASVARTISDLVVLSINREHFRSLPVNDGALGPDAPPSALRRIERRMARALRVSGTDLRSATAGS